MFGHLPRHNLFMTNIIEDRIIGRKSRGKPRKAYIEDKLTVVDMKI